VNVPEDVKFAESRVRAETIAAEDVLHDMGAISMMSSDSQGMGRIGETITRTWQLAHKMKSQFGSRFPHDNDRIKRYIAKYTINPAVAHGISDYVGSLEPGKIADIVLWDPRFFGIKPDTIIKGGVVAYNSMGVANSTIMFCEPMIYKPNWGGTGSAPASLSLLFTNKVALEGGLRERVNSKRRMVPVKATKNLSKKDMLHNDLCPNISVDPETYEVRVDGELVTCEPADTLPLNNVYILD